MKLTRRAALNALGLTAFTAASLSATRLLLDPRHQYVCDVVRAQLPYLQYTQESLDEFADELVRVNPTLSSTRAHVTAFLGQRTSQLILGFWSHRFRMRLATYEERIAGLFLLSSDFFQNGSDVEKEVSYIALADPYEYPCNTPLARLNGS